MYEEINYKELSKYCRDLTIEEATEITENEKKSTKRLLKFLIFSFIFVSIFLVLIIFDFLKIVKMNIELILIDKILLEKMNSIFGIIVEIAIIIVLNYLIYFIFKRYKSYKEYYISLFSNPIIAGKDYEIFNGVVLKKEKVEHSIRGDDCSYYMLTLGLEQDIYKCVKIECSDAKNRKIKIGDAISVRKEKEATSLKTCQILI